MLMLMDRGCNGETASYSTMAMAMQPHQFPFIAATEQEWKFLPGYRRGASSEKLFARVGFAVVENGPPTCPY